MPNPLSISNFRNRTSIIAILLFVAVVMAIETSFTFLPQNRLVQTFRTNVMPPQSPDCEIMGDSVAHDGIIATQVAAFLPKNQFAFNGALAGTGPEFSYFILKRQIAAGKAPKSIIYAPSPHTFSSQRVALLIGGYCRWEEIFEVVATGLSPSEVAYGILCKLSYTLRYREQLKMFLKGRFQTESEGSGTPDAGTTRPTKPSKRWLIEHHPMYKSPFVVQRFNGGFVRKFLQLAKDRNIPVYWVTMPVLPAASEMRRPFHFDQTYYEFLETLGKGYDVRLLQKEFIVWDDNKFKDTTHLNEVGALEFSALIGEKISEVSQIR